MMVKLLSKYIFMFIMLRKPPKARKPLEGHFQRPTLTKHSKVNEYDNNLKILFT